MIAKDICLLASQEAKGGTGMVALAGQHLNLVLEDLKLNHDLKVNRVTQLLVVQGGTNGPFTLETDYLRTYDMFYPLQTPNGMTQFLTPITMEQYDAEFKATQTANYPYEFATDLSTQAQAASAAGASTGVTGLSVTSAGLGYWTNPALVFSGGVGGGGAATSTLRLLGSVANWTNGAGYVIGDIITVVGGTFTRPATIRLIFSNSVFEVVDGGAYTILPGTQFTSGGMNLTGFNGTVTTSGGSGVGLTIQAAWELGDPIITAPGVYTSAPTVIASGGSPTVAGTLTASIGTTNPGVNGKGQLYIYPQSNGQLTITHRYMRDQPDIVSPETSTQVPWFPFTDYLIKRTAARLMGITGDDRQSTYLKETDDMLRPHLIMEGDEQQTVRAVRLDPRHFKSNRGLRPTKQNPY